MGGPDPLGAIAFVLGTSAGVFFLGINVTLLLWAVAALIAFLGGVFEWWRL